MTDRGDVQGLMLDAFLAYVDGLHESSPEQSYAYCFTFALRALHYGTEGGNMANAPALPGSVSMTEVFGDEGQRVEAFLAQVYPDRSQAWCSEMAERILMGEDGLEDELRRG